MKFIYLLEVLFPTPPPPPLPLRSPVSHLHDFTTSPLSHALQLPLLHPPQLPLSLPQPFSPPFIYHQRASITNPPLNYNATATPPSLLVTNNNITLSPSLIYQLSLYRRRYYSPPLSITAATATTTLLTLHYYHHLSV